MIFKVFEGDVVDVDLIDLRMMVYAQANVDEVFAKYNERGLLQAGRTVEGGEDAPQEFLDEFGIDSVLDDQPVPDVEEAEGEGGGGRGRDFLRGSLPRFLRTFGEDRAFRLEN